MRLRRAAAVAVLGVSLATPACGPVVSEVRSTAAPPKAASCTLEYLKVQPSGQSWELIGQLVVQDENASAAFSTERRALLQPRACRMGGDALAVLATPEPSPEPVPVTNYGVFRQSP
jgi:hypothetical protein